MYAIRSYYVRCAVHINLPVNNFYLIAGNPDTTFDIVFAFVHRSRNDLAKIAFVAPNTVSSIAANQLIVTLGWNTRCHSVAFRKVENHHIVVLYFSKTCQTVIRTLNYFRI